MVISNRAKLDLKLSHLVIRGEETKQIHLSEISQIMIENTAVSLTACLLCELVKRKIKVIFCDELRNPQSELSAYYGAHDTSDKVRTQVNWTSETKQRIWTEIVREKIRNQMRLLHKYSLRQAELLAEYISEVEINDRSNREGHAAKVYFNALFGKDFIRDSETIYNAALNYGYAILLSAFNREVTSNGYITQLGLFHDNMFNQFNLSSDIMEPFRVLVDEAVYSLKPEIFERNEKMHMVNILNQRVIMEGQKQYVNNAIKIYCKSVFLALNENNPAFLRFYRDEF